MAHCIAQPAGSPLPHRPRPCDATPASDTYSGVEQASNRSVTEINCLAHREGTGVLLLSHYLIVLIHDYSDYHYYAMWQNVVARGKR